MLAACLTNKLGIGLLPRFGLRAPEFIIRRYLISPSRPTKLELIGHLQKASESLYEPGQIFLHKKFGYRGIVLQCWKGKLFDRNLQSTESVELTSRESPKGEESEINVYQVLTDQSDTEICNSALKPGITFLPDDKRAFNSIYIVSEMDYVFHDDIIPYVPQDASPIKNQYFSEFLLSAPDKDPPFIPTDHLKRWIEARKQSLEVTSIHREVTEGIQTTVLPFYMGRRVTEDKKENDVRYYHSHIHFPMEWAHMWGTFRFERHNGTSLDVKIPSFPLYDPTCSSNSSNENLG
ncbi:hypothetical protein Smp_024500.1 [Schistosoma mansoni]|uniref:hypothetical protein n=1 Tax=Schistosoma mansoni TaxID=6183 RepID=UPI0001A635D0|nr:hypothetical protein Smp_024500.1 [Schistosoma mansoni]|eukprot:XP_018648034.1 hypothetical protein Smp_024500.1 [Schistosoma mansoni]